MKQCIAILMAVLLTAGCAAHTGLTPAGEGNLDLNASIGGPFLPLMGTHIPAPYLTAGGHYGISDRLNADGQLHLTSLAYGVAGLDLGATWFPVRNRGWRPTLGLRPRLMMLAGLRSGAEDRFRVYPLLSASAAWQAGPGFLYAGTDWTVPLTRPDYDEQAVSTIWSPFAGYRWDLNERYRLSGQLKLHGANAESRQAAVDYLNAGGRGALAVMIGFEWRLGR